MINAYHELGIGTAAAFVSMLSGVPTDKAIEIVKTIAKEYSGHNITAENYLTIVERGVAYAIFGGPVPGTGQDNQSAEYDGGSEETTPPPVR